VENEDIGEGGTQWGEGALLSGGVNEPARGQKTKGGNPSKKKSKKRKKKASHGGSTRKLLSEGPRGQGVGSKISVQKGSNPAWKNKNYLPNGLKNAGKSLGNREGSPGAKTMLPKFIEGEKGISILKSARFGKKRRTSSGRSSPILSKSGKNTDKSRGAYY